MIKETPDGFEFQVFVQPRSSKNQIAGRHGDALKVRLTAPPVDGAANALCVKYLAKCLGVPKSALEIVAGHTGRTKRIRVVCTAGAAEKSRLRASIASLF